MALSTQDRVIYTARLKEAREARHAIITGNAVIRLTDQNGETYSYSQASLRALNAYITELETALGLDNTFTAPKPIGFFF